MWSVIRKRQGLEYPLNREHEEGWKEGVNRQDAFTENAEHFARFEVAANPKPQDPTSVNLAYGDFAYPKLVRQIEDELLVIRQKALSRLALLTRKYEHVMKLIEAGATAALTRLLRDRDATVRRITCEALYYFAEHKQGVADFVDNFTLEAMLPLLHDEDVGVRRQLHAAVHMASASERGARQLLHAKYMPTVVEKLLSDVDDIKEKLLETTARLVAYEEGTTAAIAHRGVPALVSLLRHGDAPVREGAVRCLGLICQFKEGKLACLAPELGTTNALVNLLEDPSPPVRREAAGALMATTIEILGKNEVVSAVGVVPLLLALVTSEDTTAARNAIQVRRAPPRPPARLG
eukprot:tig00021072_g17987.t1